MAFILGPRLETLDDGRESDGSRWDRDDGRQEWGAARSAQQHSAGQGFRFGLFRLYSFSPATSPSAVTAVIYLLIIRDLKVSTTNPWVYTMYPILTHGQTNLGLVYTYYNHSSVNVVLCHTPPNSINKILMRSHLNECLCTLPKESTR